LSERCLTWVVSELVKEGQEVPNLLRLHTIVQSYVCAFDKAEIPLSEKQAAIAPIALALWSTLCKHAVTYCGHVGFLDVMTSLFTALISTTNNVLVLRLLNKPA
jgi:hypothetical protein